MERKTKIVCTLGPATENEEVLDDLPVEEELLEEVDDIPVRGTRPLSDIYDRCNLVASEPTNVEEAMESQTWVAAMKEELNMIEKNDT